MNHRWDTIHPVVMAVPIEDRHLKGREKVAALGRYARQALNRSAEFSGVSMGPLNKNEKGAPIPTNGIHWSLSHKSAFVAAVTAGQPIGIDIEKLRECSKALYERIASPNEWDLAPTVTQVLFFRIWTAKEAVLKAAGQGLTGLSDCRILSIDDTARLTVQYKDATWRVVQYRIGDDHIASVTENAQTIEWHLITERD